MAKSKWKAVPASVANEEVPATGFVELGTVPAAPVSGPLTDTEVLIAAMRQVTAALQSMTQTLSQLVQIVATQEPLQVTIPQRAPVSYKLVTDPDGTKHIVPETGHARPKGLPTASPSRRPQQPDVGVPGELQTGR